MNSYFVSLGIESWKPVLTALVLPPMPLLLLTLVGARLLTARRARRGLGWLLVLISVAMIWLSACSGAARQVSSWLLEPQVAMSFERIRELRAEVTAKKPLAIVVLGAGIEPFAPEYGISSLQVDSLERLRYGIWLSRQTGAPIAFSGGIGWVQDTESAEASVAARVAAAEFGQPIRWVEAASRDTRENAAKTLALLQPAGIDHIVVVTDGRHMRRALRAFRQAAGAAVKIEAAPTGLANGVDRTALEWLPSSRGFERMRQVLREAMGWLAGA